MPDDEAARIVAVVRAACGALAGMFVAGLIWLQFTELGAFPLTLLFAVLVVAFAYGAARHGDAFWSRLLRNPFW